MLTSGTRLGTYEIRALIGVGGMGEVYQAHDTKLGRDVAIKVLPEQFACDSDRLARFRREAHVLASLNHPNIAATYGLEDSGEIHYLVLEFVAGDTLAQQLAREGPLQIEEALNICRQIADALEAAHEKPIVHRDLKPANVKVTPEGVVKVLDFGLAKAYADDPTETVSGTAPTLTMTPTMPGVIMGTPAYMSPEQTRSKRVDKRADIWAFGCVLYELITGKQAFPGESLAEIIASVLKGEPDWQALPAATPTQVRDLLRPCLQKDKTQRLRDAGDARIEIHEALAAPATASSATVPRIAGWRGVAVLSVAALVVAAIAGVAVWNLKPAPPTPPQPVSRLVMTLAPGERLAGLDLTAMALSPDGTQLAYVAERDGTARLFLRALDSSESKPIPGTERASSPFFSPDGQWLGFFAANKLQKVAVSGGAPVVLASVVAARGGSWGSDGQIVFAPAADSGLSRVSASGGTPEALTTLDRKKGEGSHRFPHHLPGGQAILFTVGTGGSWDDALIVAQRLDTGERKVLVQGGSDARYLPTGHLMYARAGALLAVPFDLNRLEVTGTPVAVVEGVMQTTNQTGTVQAAFSGQGWLMYVPGGAPGSDRKLVWVDRKGTEQLLQVPPRAYGRPRLSPDGQRLVVEIDLGNNADSWVHDIARGTLSRVAVDASGVGPRPLWTLDGRKLTYRSNKAGAPNLFWIAADGSGVEERLTTGEYGQTPESWSPDGQLLAFTEANPTTGNDIWVLGLSNRKAQPFLQTRFSERDARFSPDGRWLAYTTNDSGRAEIYIQPYPGPGGKWQISAEGGALPEWNRNGRELFYRNIDKMMAVDITAQPTFTAGKPRMLFEGQGVTADYDVSADGQRFLMVKESEQTTSVTQFSVVLNWFEELKRRVPAQK